MSRQNLKIAVIGDYNFTYNTHHATNLALDHAAHFLELDLSYYWVKIEEASQFKNSDFKEFDGFWISPAPFKNPFYLNGILKSLMELKKAVFISGEAFKIFIDVLITIYHINLSGEKMISDNLIDGESFERVEITPHSDALKKLYENHNNIELTSSRYSMYPSLIDYLNTKIIDIEGFNQFDDPEIISLKNHPFFVASAFCPQISSTREIPHPLVYTFLKACLIP